MNQKLIVIQLTCAVILFGLSISKLSINFNVITILALLHLIIFIKFHNYFLLVVPILGLLLASFRGSGVWSNLNLYNKYYDRDINFAGNVDEDAVYGFRRQVEFFVKNVAIGDIKLPGKIKVAGFGQIDVKRGDNVFVSGQLRDGFGSYQGSVGFATYHVISRQSSPIETFRQKFIASTYSYIPEPQASLGLGFLAGYRSLLPEELTEDLSTTGLTHIVAVSGYNTTIIASAVHALVARRGSRYQVVIATLTVLAIFITLTGAAPSIMRASVVSVVALIGWYFGKHFKPSVLLLFSAALTAWLSPINFWFSLGWWLSFLAFFGILIIAPTITARYFKKTPNLLVKTAIETTSAQLMTLPVIIWTFGEASAVSVLANMLVLPFVPLAMLATFVVGTSGLLFPPFAQILVWPTKLILSYIVKIITWLAKVPWALQELTLQKFQMFMIYGLIITVVWLIKRKITLLKRQLYTLY